MKKIESFMPNLSLVASFIIAAAAAYLLVSHFQHTVLQAWTSTSGQSSFSSQSEYAQDKLAYTSPGETNQDDPCGCPLCCAGITE